MFSLLETRLECNSNIKINFDGGDLSSDTGMLLSKRQIQPHFNLSTSMR